MVVVVVVHRVMILIILTEKRTLTMRIFFESRENNIYRGMKRNLLTAGR